MLIVQLPEFTGHIWKIGIEDGITLPASTKTNPALLRREGCVVHDSAGRFPESHSGKRSGPWTERIHRTISGASVCVRSGYGTGESPRPMQAIDEVIIHRAAGKERELSSSGKRYRRMSAMPCSTSSHSLCWKSLAESPRRYCSAPVLPLPRDS